jgi:hypothetical protein
MSNHEKFNFLTTPYKVSSHNEFSFPVKAESKDPLNLKTHDAMYCSVILTFWALTPTPWDSIGFGKWRTKYHFRPSCPFLGPCLRMKISRTSSDLIMSGRVGAVLI